VRKEGERRQLGIHKRIFGVLLLSFFTSQLPFLSLPSSLSVLPDRALCLPTSSHILIVNSSFSPLLSLPPFPPSLFPLPPGPQSPSCLQGDCLTLLSPSRLAL